MTDAVEPPHPPTPEGVAAQLDLLVAGRAAALDRIVVSARRAGIGALLLIGSLGRGGGDAFSDLDLIAVPGADHGGLDLAEVFGRQVLARLDAPRNAPAGGEYLGLCLEVAQTAAWVDWYLWPPATAVIPADATPVYDDLGLATSDQDFIPLIRSHGDPAAPAHPDDAVTELLRVAVAAKYLARKDFHRLTGKVAQARGLAFAEIAELLRRKLAGITPSGLAPAVRATRRLVDLAAAAGGGL
jgi:hypothetical protein